MGGEGKAVEADESYIGGKAKNRAHRKPAPKKAVFARALRISQTTECAANKPQNAACRSLVQRDFPVRLASVTPENVVIVGAGDGRKRRSNFVVDPASGALVLTARAGLKFEKALRRQARLMAFRLYLKMARLYFLELRFKARLTVLRIRCKASSGALLWY